MRVETSPHTVQTEKSQNGTIIVEMTLFPLEKAKELIKPETTETGAGNSSTINARRRIQRFNPGWRRR